MAFVAQRNVNYFYLRFSKILPMSGTSSQSILGKEDGKALSCQSEAQGQRSRSLISRAYSKSQTNFNNTQSYDFHLPKLV